MIKLKNANLIDKLNTEFTDKLAGKIAEKLNVPESYQHKLKELKTWAQVKGPKLLQPALSYTLGWLSPELLGTGFRMVEVSDFEIQALVPAQAGNLDQHDQVHQGLVLNASLELARSFMCRYLPESYFQITSSEIKISKKHKWNSDLKITLVCEESTLDQFFGQLQEDKKATLHLQLKVENNKSKKTDSVDLHLVCEATNLLA